MKNKMVILLIVIGVVLTSTCVASIAYNSIGGKQELANTFTSGCLSITLDDVSDAINLAKTKPISDVEGLETPGYTFTVKNNCHEEANYQINLETLLDPSQETTLHDEYVRVAIKSDSNDYLITDLNENTSATPSIKGAKKAYNLTSGTLEKDETKEFVLKEWMDYDTTKEQGASKAFQSKINVIAGTNFEVNTKPEIKFNLDENNNMVGSLKGDATEIKYCKSTLNECTPETVIDKESISVKMEDAKEIVCVSIDNGDTICSDPKGVYKGAGTEESPYLIQAIEDLVILSNEVNNGNTYEGKTFKLTRNLDFKNPDSYRDSERTDFGNINGVGEATALIDELTNTEGTGFPPIGNSISFKGDFDGDGYTLSNLYIHNFEDTTKRYALFGNIYGSTIKDLKLDGSVTTDVARDIGGLVGYAKNSTFERIETNVEVTSSVGNNSIGGLISSFGEEAGSTNKIINCVNRGNISNGNNTGGLAGYLANKTKLIIENSSNYGTISNNLGSHVGGLLGRDNGSESELEIKTSHNYGEINMIENNKDSERRVGGLIGYYQGNLTINNSTNENKITVDAQGTGDINVGGILGYSSDGLTVNLNNVHNKGKIKAENNSTTDALAVGGIVGKSRATTTITNSSNEIEITNEESGIFVKRSAENRFTYVGGLIGISHAFLKIEDSYNTSDINGGNRTGGIVGASFENSTMLLNKCFNTGNIKNQKDSPYESQLGGIISMVWNGATGYIINSYNTGAVIVDSKSFSRSSGIVDYTFDQGSISAKTYIINSYNIGPLVSSSSSVGLAHVEVTSSITLNNVYNLGSLEAPNKYGILNSTTSGKVDVKNAYYLEEEGLSASNVSTNGSNITINAIAKSANDMKTKAFVNTLNNNINDIDLGSIDSALSGYKLEKWVLGSNGYPTFSY